MSCRIAAGLFFARHVVVGDAPDSTWLSLWAGAGGSLRGDLGSVGSGGAIGFRGAISSSCRSSGMNFVRSHSLQILLLPGLIITTWFGSKIQRVAGIPPELLVAVIFGILMTAWSPFLPLIFELRDIRRNLQALEERLGKVVSGT